MDSETPEPLVFEILGHLGNGTFAQVKKIRFKNQICAAKVSSKKSKGIDKEYIAEVDKLKNLSHPNIIKLIAVGTCTILDIQSNCLIIEYADTGSLYDLLHKSKHEYTINHAISWMYQCSDAVNYMHTLKPKPTIHRDLKTLNMLLMNGGTLLKICDFGVACDQHTLMSLDQGTPSWMAPEVMSQPNYNEKCDVYSFVIVAWEILTRLAPYFDQKNLSKYSLIFAVNNSKLRPRPIKNCPKIFELILKLGMDADPNKRPSMQVIYDIMKHLDGLFNKEPIQPIVVILPELVTVDSKVSSNSSNSFVDLSETVKVETHQSSEFGSKNSLFQNKAIGLSQTDSLSNEFIRGIDGRLSHNRIGSQKLNLPGHKRSKSFGYDVTKMKAVDENEKIKEDLCNYLPKMIVNPIAPISGNQLSLQVYNEHQKLIETYQELEKESNKKKFEISKLEQVLKNIKQYNDLTKQKTTLTMDIRRLKSQIKN